jgi:purine-binding chemotaxis protein CheW
MATTQINQRASGAIQTGGMAQAPLKYLAFGLGTETYAMQIGYVKEVIQVESLTRVPLMPEFIRGVINLRGSVVPVLDLSIRFGQAPTEVARRTCISILQVPHDGGMVDLGIMVDNVSAVLDLSPSDIDAAPSFGKDPRAEFICGIGKHEGKFIILLDVERVLSAEEFSSLSQGQNGSSS